MRAGGGWGGGSDRGRGGSDRGRGRGLVIDTSVVLKEMYDVKLSYAST